MTMPLVSQGDASEQPSFHMLASKEEQARKVTPFYEWAPEPITVPSPPSEVEGMADYLLKGHDDWSALVLEQGRDSYGQPFVDMGVDPEDEETRRQERALKRLSLKARVGAVLPEDSWKIGQEGTAWVEPEGTSKSDYDISRPPFSRLMDATLDFHFSRTWAMQDRTNLGLFNLIRHMLGLKTQTPGLHWPGLGSDGQRYTMTHAAKRSATKDLLHLEGAGGIGEVCSLLREPEQAIRHALTLAKEETEGVIPHAAADILFAEMIAALMSFFEYYNALPDVHISSAMQRATAMAKAGPRLLRQAAQLEGEIKRADGFNSAAWSLLCQAEDDMNLPKEASDPPEGNDENDWVIAQPIVETKRVSKAEASDILGPLCSPIAPGNLRVLKYLPYDRRIVSAVFPPESEGPHFTTSSFRVRTVPAPWTEEEPWPKPESEDTGPPSAAAAATVNDAVQQVAQQSSGEAEHEIDIWIDTEHLGDSDGKWMIGMGLRASWAEIGVDEQQSWWIARLIDYVLPAIWKATQAELDAAANDPKAPWELDPASFALQPASTEGP